MPNDISRINEETFVVRGNVTVDADNLEDNKLKVFLRIRPSPEKETIVKPSDDRTTITFQSDDAIKSDLGFSCDHVFDGAASQEFVYQKITPDLLQSFVDGRNVCIFAYGQTGSGKTHSILGGQADLGLLPRFVEEVLQNVSTEIKEEAASVEVSFYEIYKEKVYDLLSHKKNVLKVRGAEKVYLEDLTAFPIKNPNDFKKVLIFGLSKRATSATLVNDASSRSHAIFQIKLRKNQKQMVNDEAKSFVVMSDCYFVDLAGSERLSFTQGGDRAETAAINCSLLALQKVIECKANGGSAFVNYRESVLTRLLKECFGGNSKTALLATISSAMEYRQFTLQTLRFSMNAGRVQQIPKQNVDPFFHAIQCLKARNEAMEAELEKLRNGQIEEQPDVPCVVELSSDASLAKPWSKLTATPMSFGSVEDAPPIVQFSSDESSCVFLECLKKEVVVNGQFLDLGEKVKMKHGDRVVLDGRRMFVICADANVSMKQLPTFHQVKLEYVEKTFPLVERKMREMARSEFEQDQDEVLQKLNEELEVTKSELAKMQKKMDGAKSSTEEKKYRKRYSELQEGLQETETFRSNLLNIAKEQSAAFKQPIDLTGEQKEELMRLRANISTVKHLLDAMLKHTGFAFTINSSSDSTVEVASVRIFNRRNKTFADLTPRDFDQLYQQLVDYYQDSPFAKNPAAPSSSECVKHVESLLYGGTWVWRKIGMGRRSSIFANTMTSIMKDTATARRSTVGDLRKSVKARRSVIAEALEIEEFVDEDSPWGVLVGHLNLMRLHFDDEYVKHPGIVTALLALIGEISQKMETAVHYAANKDVSGKDLQSAVFAFSSFSSIVDSLRVSIQCMEAVAESKDTLLDLGGAAELLAKEKNRWISAVAENAESAEIFAKNMEHQIEVLYYIIGGLSFWRNEGLPEGVPAKVKERFHAGILKSVEESCSDVKKIYKEYKTSGYSRSVIVVMLCKCIVPVFNSIMASYDDQLTFSVLRPLVECKIKICEDNVEWELLLRDIAQLLVSLKQVKQANTVMIYKLQSDLKLCQRLIDAVVDTNSKTQTLLASKNK